MNALKWNVVLASLIILSQFAIKISKHLHEHNCRVRTRYVLSVQKWVATANSQHTTTTTTTSVWNDARDIIKIFFVPFSGHFYAKKQLKLSDRHRWRKPMKPTNSHSHSHIYCLLCSLRLSYIEKLALNKTKLHRLMLLLPFLFASHGFNS